MSDWSFVYCNAESDTGYTFEKLTFNTGLFLLDSIVNVASEYIAPSGVLGLGVSDGAFIFD